MLHSVGSLGFDRRGELSYRRLSMLLDESAPAQHIPQLSSAGCPIPTERSISGTNFANDGQRRHEDNLIFVSASRPFAVLNPRVKVSCMQICTRLGRRMERRTNRRPYTPSLRPIDLRLLALSCLCILGNVLGAQDTTREACTCIRACRMYVEVKWWSVA